MGRVVLTHSTYIKGLIPKLKLLAKYSGIKTVTPGEINRTKGQGGILNLKLSTSIRGGYKLIARKGKSVQEIFVVTELDKDILEIILKSIIKSRL
ncbi:DUF2103 domain-containing protein [Prochlorococcus sp. MIT 1307]|uniref:DUF2103 domain-containing protein n=1 Tax=Prochlorococcus sp. MIT 1307 TaxID=3096219 RepID=UPI002A7573EA|nr:DUF2103 domain-containing protein [Prochlorococcus sp. MIT 1307]